MNLIDSHAHLDFDAFSEDLPAVLERARAAGLIHVHTIGTRLSGLEAVQKIAADHPEVLLSAGIHPHHVDGEDIGVERIVSTLMDVGAIGVGETGLDFYYDHGDRERQQASFRNHIRAAHLLELPLIIHTREAENATRQILNEEGAQRVGGVLHCFTGTMELARWAVSQGFYLSFSGIITFKTAQSLREVAAWVPRDRFLIETDSPYLAPIPYRGKRNEPSYVAQVAAAVAQARGEPLATVAKWSSDNFRRLFKVGGKGASGETLAYPIGNRLYLNVTKACTLHCGYCPKWHEPVVHDFDLSLSHNPTAEALIAAMGDFSSYEEVVFCGYGEPTLRLSVVLAVAAHVKQAGVRVRINTDGLANLVFKEDVTPRFAGLVDAVSVSLSAQDELTYARHCQPALPGSYAAVLDFLRAVKGHVPEVTATAIEGLDGVDIEACRAIARELGVGFRVRYLNKVG